MSNLFSLLITNKEFVGIVATFFGVIIPLATFLITKNREQKLINFEKFHKDLMKGLANLDANTGLDQQVAIVFELRNYPEYYPVIRRILKAQISRWKIDLKKKPHFHQLIDEATETIKYINKNFIVRLFSKRR